MDIHIGVIESGFDEENSNYSLWSNESDIKGWGKRYRVRIPGIHSEDKSVTPDSSLPVAEVIYPVTAGTGHDATYQVDALKPGSIVTIWEDNNKRLFINGCKGNNERTPLARGPQEIGFIPYSLAVDGPLFNIAKSGNKFWEASTNTFFVMSWANHYEQADGTQTSVIATTTNCQKTPLGSIQIKIQNFIKDITEVKNWLSRQKQSAQDFLNSSTLLNKTIDNLQTFAGGRQNSTIEEWIKSKIQLFSKDISKDLKSIITQIEAKVKGTINDKLKQFYNKLFPNQLQQFKDKVETANDLVACLFRKIVKNLIKMCAKFLESAWDKIANVATCVVDNFVGGLIGKIIGLITSSIDKILQPIKAILGVFDIGQDILGVIEDLLTNLSCDEKPTCAKISEWSVWDGPESIFEETIASTTNLFNKAKSFASSVQGAIDPDNFDFDLDFADVFQDTCNVASIACGPPIVEFLGGGGSGASGNAIVNALGQIIGIDIVKSGSGYTSAPVVKFKDACGNGSGAVARSVIGIVPIQTTSIGGNLIQNQTTIGITGITTTTTGIVNVIIEDPGVGYLPAPDGSSGSNGLTITPAPAPGTNGSATISTLGSYPTKADGGYPVIMKLCEVLVEDGGFNYAQTDEIIITPSNGAELKPFFTESGSLYKVDVLKNGEGFKELPEISIQSSTGYNAKMLPRLCAERVGDDLTKTRTIGATINVISCPGK
jgi:hypothetical protein